MSDALWGLVYFFSLCCSLYLLVKATDKFVEGSVALALYWKVKPMLIGLTLVAMGTSLPEAVVAIIAGYMGLGQMAVGNVLGSNIANIGLALGFACLLGYIHFEKKVLRLEIPMLLLATLSAGLLLLDYELNKYDASLLFLLWVLVLIVLIKMYRRSDVDLLEDVEEAKTLRYKQAWLYFVFGLLLLVGSARWLVWSAESLARMLGMSELFIGLTIVAIGTSLPEIMVSVISTRKGHYDVALGNVIGSNIFNTLLVLALSAMFGAIAVDSEVILRDYATNLLLTLVLLLALLHQSRKNYRLGRKMGLFFIIVYFLWLFRASAVSLL